MEQEKNENIEMDAADEQENDTSLSTQEETAQQPATEKTKRVKPTKELSAEAIAEVEHIIEALLFVSAKPLSVERMHELLKETHSSITAKEQLYPILNELMQKYRDDVYSWQLLHVAGGYQFVTKKTFMPWIKKMYKARFTIRLSQSALETLSIIAYRQPVTKAEIDDIRGVDSVGVVNTLLARKLIRISGYKEGVRKPPQFSTTPEFLRYFGLNSVDELPLPEHIDVDASNVRSAQSDDEDTVTIVENRIADEDLFNGEGIGNDSGSHLEEVIPETTDVNDMTVTRDDEEETSAMPPPDEDSHEKKRDQGMHNTKEEVPYKEQL